MSTKTVAKTAHVAQAQKSSARPQNPLLCLLYRARSRAVHAMVGKIQAETGPVTQLLMLGAGLDVSFQQPGTVVFAVDLPAIVKEREAAAHVPPSVDIAFDLSRLSTTAGSQLQLIEALGSRGLDWTAPTIVVTEMVLGYLPEAAVRALLLLLSCSLARAFFVSYDVALDASSGYSQTLLKEFDKRGAPLRCCHPTHAAHWAMFRDCGWARGFTCSMHRAASGLFESSTLQMAETDDDDDDDDDMVFDEYAALALLQARYCITVACAGAYLAPDAETTALVQRIIPSAFVTPSASTTSSSSSSSSNSTSVPTYSLRPALCSDGAAVSSLYLGCMQQYADKHSSVRKFGRTAVKQLANLGKFFGCDDGGGVEAKSEEKREEEQKEGVTQKSKARFWVVCAQVDEGVEEVVGCVGLRVGKASGKEEATAGLQLIGEVQHMCVSHGHRRRGLASQLLSALDSRARDLGCRRLELSVLTDLAAARELYAHRGFVGEKIADLGSGCRIEHMVLDF